MATREDLHKTMALMQATIREHLAPIAEEYDKPLDPGLVSAMMFDRDSAGEGQPRYWQVHLYTLSPGLVIGHGGATAQARRDRLCDVSGDPNLRLNLIDFAKVHEETRRPIDERS